MILDGVGGETEQWAVGLLKPWSGAKYVTLVTPLLHDTDSLGLLGGAFQAGLSLHNTALQVETSAKQDVDTLLTLSRLSAIWTLSFFRNPASATPQAAFSIIANNSR